MRLPDLEELYVMKPPYVIDSNKLPDLIFAFGECAPIQYPAC